MILGSNSCTKTLAARARKLNARASKLKRPLVERVVAEDLTSILALYGEECFYCGDGIFFGGERANASFDHVVPLARGGRNVKKNLVPSCRLCNNRKGDKMLEYKNRRIRFRYPS